MNRKVVASLPDTSTIYDLYDLMNVITHLNPSFHPDLAQRIVHIKVDAEKVQEAKRLLQEIVI